MAGDNDTDRPREFGRRSADVLYERLERSIDVFSGKLEVFIQEMVQFRLKLPDNYITRREIAERDQEIDRRFKVAEEERTRIQTESDRKYGKIEATIARMYVITITTLCTALLAVLIELSRRIAP